MKGIVILAICAIATTQLVQGVDVPTVQVDIDVANTTVSVPSTLAGVELEGVGHSIYGGGLYSQLIFDESFEDPKDDPAQGKVGNYVTLSVYNTSKSLRHCNALLYETNFGLGPNDDHYFKVVPGLNGTNGTVSFQSRNFPTYYIAPINGSGPGAPVGGTGRLGVVQDDKTSHYTDLATFRLKPTSAGADTFSIIAYDGRMVSLSPTLTGSCAGQFKNDQGKDIGLLATPNPGSVFQLNKSSAPTSHWTYLGDGKPSYSTVDPFHGHNSLVMDCSSVNMQQNGNACLSATNKNVYRRGISILEGKDYEGFLFLKLLSGNAANVSVNIFDTVGESLGESLAKLHFTVTSEEWTMFNVSLMPTTSSNSAAFVISLHNQAAIGVDMVFFEPGSWGRFHDMHVRKDVAEGLLLNGSLRSIRLDGTSVVANPNYVWKHARGPVYIRPPRYGDCWYGYISNGFLMFEAMQIAEIANLDFVTIGVNVRAETTQSAMDFVEYVFGNTSTPMGQLRAQDGHPAPYPTTLVVELGNEEYADDYATHALSIATAMRQHLTQIAPNALNKIKFAIAFLKWRHNWTLAEDMVAMTNGHPEVLTWDQHDVGVRTSVDGAFQDHDQLVAWLRSKGWTSKTPMFIGETNCNTNRGLCDGVERALTNGLYSNYAARRGYVGSVSPAVWAYSTCNENGDICGATDGTTNWPQAAMIITPNNTIAQPSWYAHKMISDALGDVIVSSHTNNFLCPTELSWFEGDNDLDIVAMKNKTTNTVYIHIVMTCNMTLNIEFALSNLRQTTGTLALATILSSSSSMNYNTVAQPYNVIPNQQSIDVNSGKFSIQVPPLSLTTITLS
eukprot:m.10286 g.10286  ORF g.10286 m.10286 type:complete len:840 (+) comp4236_c0_seq1:97-2616(+)